MFESAEIGHKISKTAYSKELPKLRKALLDAQFAVRKTQKFQVLIVVGGVDGAGRGHIVKLLNEWMDARYIETNALTNAAEHDPLHPPMWKFWNVLPSRGKTGIFFGSWYTAPIVNRVFKRISGTAMDKALSMIVNFEKMLSDEGVLILKFWFHLSRQEQKKRLKKLKKDSKKGWRVNPIEKKHYLLYDKFRAVSEKALMVTDTAEAPWIIVEAADERYRALTVGKELLAALKKRLSDKTLAKQTRLTHPVTKLDDKILLRSFNYKKNIKETEYKNKLLKLQQKLNELVAKAAEQSRSIIVVFEGMDASGKGSAIRRISGALDPRNYRIVSIAAPTDEEKLHPYLWRFWRHIPSSGKFVVFDRSWYGRVLVERIENFCSASDWRRAYSEINDFEVQVTDGSAIIQKFWMGITQDEQLKRFKAREKIGYKNYKLTGEDWRNRRKWNLYEEAAGEMISRTGTINAPWKIIASNNKHYAHIIVLKTLCNHIEKSLE